MLNENIIKIIDGVNSIEEFNFQLNKFKLIKNLLVMCL